MRRIQKGLCLFLALGFLFTLFPASVFAAWEHGNKGKADFTKILVGKDGKESVSYTHLDVYKRQIQRSGGSEGL